MKKRWISILLLACTAVALTACKTSEGGNESQSSAGGESSESSVLTSDGATSESATLGDSAPELGDNENEIDDQWWLD